MCGNFREPSFYASINSTALEISGVSLDEAGFAGYKINANIGKMALFILYENGSILFVLLLVNCFCAAKITYTLKKSSISKHVKKYHGQMFLLLLLQTACPAILMQAPVCLMYVMLFTDTSSTATETIVIGILLALFPVFDPIIIIVFLKDYRNFILSKISSGRFQWLPSQSRQSRHQTFIGD
ncbi:hypothetical protein RB195_016702 [Necator americanus]|uniref:7TM GPCR serpentine receptor class x (Srx) domain-containing protein n=1 Tax=Necator americanus TaxID=51031 RepID=A0ABR1C1R2_NECAM